MDEEIDAIARVGAVGSTDLAPPPDSGAGTSSAARTTAAAGQPADKLPSQPSAAAIQAAVQRVNAHLATVNRVLELHVDAGTGLTIATIRNAQTGAMLQQFPSADSIHLAQMLADWSPGKHVLVDLIA